MLCHRQIHFSDLKGLNVSICFFFFLLKKQALYKVISYLPVLEALKGAIAWPSDRATQALPH